MAAKKYQIFLSSTFLDLQRERSAAVTAIMRLGHIPVGMELFPATDNKQWHVIEKAIKEADYYVLMVGGRYGSIYDGISYTEAEYNLAIDIGVPIVPILLADYENVFRERGDEDGEKLERLTIFRERLGQNHTCQYWQSEAELAALLFQGLLSAFDEHPREGWIRGSSAASEDTLTQLNQLHQERDGLKVQLAELQSQLSPKLSDIADLGDTMGMRYEYTFWRGSSSAKATDTVNMTWADIFCAVGPKLMNSVHPIQMKNALREYTTENKLVQNTPDFFSSDMDTVKIQLIALGLITSHNAKAVNGGVTEFVTLTDNGKARLSELVARRKTG